MKILGKRVMVEREKLNTGGLKMYADAEENGLTNSGTILAIGNVGLLNRLRGLKVGAKIMYKKHFQSNMGKGGEEFTFVALEEILGIQK